MSFCQKCGAEIVNGALFCGSCGTPVGQTGSSSVRKQEFVGTLKKCPNCGSEVMALEGKCNACGHVFNDVKVDNSVKEFFNKLQSFDMKEKEDLGVIKSILKQPAILCVLVGLYLIMTPAIEDNISLFGTITLITIGILVCIGSIFISPRLSEEEKQKKIL